MIPFWKKDKAQSDRRKKERVTFHLPVKLLVPSLAVVRGEGYVEVHAKNISEGGLLIEADRSYPKLVPCRVKIETIAHPQGVVLDGMIVWAEEEKEAGTWEVGIAFINVREEDRNLLHQIVLQSK